MTAGAPRVVKAWSDQLGDGGRLVVPIVNSDGVGTARCLVKRDHGLEEISRLPWLSAAAQPVARVAVIR